MSLNFRLYPVNFLAGLEVLVLFLPIPSNYPEKQFDDCRKLKPQALTDIMTPFLTDPGRSQAYQAAQLAITLRDSGKLRSYTHRDLEALLSIHHQEQEPASELTAEFLQEIQKRVGQMIALEPVIVPVAFRSTPNDMEEAVAA